MSTGDYSGRREATNYRALFARRWQRVVQANFANPSQLAAAFSVDPSTAENWWAGVNAPSGWVIGKAMCDPAMRDHVVAELTRHENA